MPHVREIAEVYRERLAAMERARAERLLAMWYDIERKLTSHAELLAARIAAGDTMITPALVLEHERYRALIAAAREERERFTALAGRVVAADQARSVEMAVEAVTEMIGVATSFRQIPREAVRAFDRWTGTPTMPLVKLLRRDFGEAVNAMVDALISQIGTGRAPAEIAHRMMDAFGVGLDRALTISRTEVLRAYRHGTQDSYRASGLVMAYRRLATHDSRVCLGCLFAEGEIFATEHDFDAHPNCRCVMVPVMVGVDEVQWLAGEDWFLAQPAETQRIILGEKRYTMWVTGEVTELKRFAKHVHDDEWGGAFVPTTLRELRGGGGGIPAGMAA